MRVHLKRLIDGFAVVMFSLAFAILLLSIAKWQDARQARIEHQRKLAREMMKPTTTPSPVRTGPATKVILSAMGRSGSTFVSQLISHHNNNTAYWFEPGKLLEQSNGEARMDIIDLTEWVFACQTTKTLNISNISMSWYWQWRDLDQGMAAMFECFNHNRKTCMQEFQESCKKSQTIVIKYIRPALLELAILLELIPNLELVYVVRNPQKVIFSRAIVIHEKSQSIAQSIEEDCARFRSDVITYNSLPDRHKEKMLLVKYEDVVDKPDLMRKYIYNHLGWNDTETAEEWHKTAQTCVPEKKGMTVMYCRRAKSLRDSIKAPVWNKITRMLEKNRDCQYVADILNYTYTYR